MQAGVESEDWWILGPCDVRLSGIFMGGRRLSYLYMEGVWLLRGGADTKSCDHGNAKDLHGLVDYKIESLFAYTSQNNWTKSCMRENWIAGSQISNW